MRISSLEEYGLRCVVVLAQASPRQQLSIPEIAQREGLSVPYVSKLLSILRRAGIVTAVRGRAGGFTLSRPSSEITLLDVIVALGGPILDPDHCAKFTGQRDECVHAEECNVHYVLDSLAGFMEEILSRTTLDDLVRRKASSLRPGNVISSDALLSKSSPDALRRNDRSNGVSYKQQRQ